MSFKDVDIGAALRRLAERRIEEAMQQGKFDNLPGSGQELELEPMPANEDARLTWWALRILRQNDFTPHEVRWRKLIDGLRDHLDRTCDENRVIQLVEQINALVRRLNTLGTNAIAAGIAPLVLEDEIARCRDRARRDLSGPT